jgi:uncharacterized protein YbaP (TraB family)
MLLIERLHLKFVTSRKMSKLIMKRTLLILLVLIPILAAAQSKSKPKKYPSLLWEITGNGLKKPSYLFGTMHVSSKIAFHLADSFYLGIRNADVVALETNPESWQEDMSKYELDYTYSMGGRYGGFLSMPNDYLSINTLKFYKYDKKIERSLYSNPSTINNLLYRSYGNESSDFEEDTYLDMYIYQCGKKWGKRVAGVERYGESMKLMQEAYKDAAKEKNRKERSYDIDEDYSSDKLQEAYRKGNLDQLDSINRLSSTSDAFDEKFLYKRNEIQANSIDSILKSKSTLFVGVGAAHLPGTRGVIEMLRQKGYKLRPVIMGERDSKHKDQVEKVRVPVTFKTEAAEDGFFKVDIPGKFYKFGEDGALDQRQYADMANGSYYMVTRIMTNAWLWGHGNNDVYKKIDSLLYENIPGKIISKTKVTKNGHTGFDITNKTRRGDLQRYNIFITPFEVIIFKMSGTGEYVKAGDEANKFFGSIQLKEYNPAAAGWKTFSPAYGGFSVEMPHDPYIGNDGSWIYDAMDKTEGTGYRVVRSDIHNYRFAEEDTFDLGLMDESFAASEFIDKQLSRKQTKYKGYPALDCKYKDKNGSIFLVRYLVQGPHYYTLVAHGKKEVPKMQSFLNSFQVQPLLYGESKERKDTSLYFTVNSPVFPKEDKEKLDMPSFGYGYGGGEEEDESETDQLEGGAYRSTVISNDTTGERVYVSFYRSPRYFYSKDTAALEKENGTSFMGDSTWIVRSKKKYELPNKMKVWETTLSDTGSSRMIWNRNYYKDGVGFTLTTLTDTLTKPSSFLQSFFSSFTPVDTLKGIDPFEKKTTVFFNDFFSSDTVAHKRAVRNIELIQLDSTDLPQLKKAIASLNWNEKKYLDTKKELINKMDDITTKETADYLKTIYYAAGDTVELQYTALETLLKHRKSYSFNVFRDIILSEPPVLETKSNNSYDEGVYRYLAAYRGQFKGLFNFSNGNFVDELYDSLALTKTILPDLLPLLNLDDYKPHMMRLLGQMIDSNLVTTKDYEMYYSKFLLEAKQEMKKQAIAEKKIAIQKAEESKLDTKPFKAYYEDDDKDSGNDDLNLYATLLMPYWDSKPAVQPLIRQMMASNDKRLKYNTLLLLIRNNKPFPDSMLRYFAEMDAYRYELYTDLKQLKKKELFPAKYNNHIDLGRSNLMGLKLYGKPDTIAYVDKLPAEIKGKKGLVYFFKYKAKKEDVNWKLAVVGLLPEDEKEYTIKEENAAFDFAEAVVPGWNTSFSSYSLTGFLEEKIKEDEPLKEQLQKELKKKLYSRRSSARNFYKANDDEYGDYFSNRRVSFGN